MKNHLSLKRLFQLPLAIALVLLATTALSAGPRPPSPPKGGLSPAEAATLTFIREEEKLARDIYVEMDAWWHIPPFENIAISEQRHMDALKNLLTKYRLPDPVDPDRPGVFVDPELQALYTDLLTQGEVSTLAALRVGALIEEVDIEDLQNAISATNNSDLKRVYNNLLQGSRNHLRAFAMAIERLGEVYQAQRLEQTAVDAIIDGPMERAGGG